MYVVIWLGCRAWVAAVSVLQLWRVCVGGEGGGAVGHTPVAAPARVALA